MFAGELEPDKTQCAGLPERAKVFTGLVEQTAKVLKAEPETNGIRLVLKRPPGFSALKEGESLCVNGLCLTLESFDRKKMLFFVGPESLKITGWNSKKLKACVVNLERALSLQSRLGGHFVTGHADGTALVEKILPRGNSLLLWIKIPKASKPFFVKKGFIALNGVSLTINQIKAQSLAICLVPQTLKSANLSLLKTGDRPVFEVDYMARLIKGGTI